MTTLCHHLQVDHGNISVTLEQQHFSSLDEVFFETLHVKLMA